MPDTELVESRPLSDTILQSQIASEEDSLALVKSLASVQEVYDKENLFRTDTQMRISVLNDVRHPTASSKLEQVYREITVMSTELFNLSCEYKMKLIDLTELEDTCNDAMNSSYDIQRKEVEIIRLKFHLKQMEKVAHHRIREIALWDTIIKEQKNEEPVPELVSLALRYCKEVRAMELMKASIPPADARNIFGLLVHSIKEVGETGLMPVFIREVSKDGELADWCVTKKILVKV